MVEKEPIHHDLDHLAGTWTDDDVKMFKENLKYFEQIDKELWLTGHEDVMQMKKGCLREIS
jgi:hypothetical protein